MRFLIHWLVVTIALAITTWILPGLHASSVASLMIMGLAIGLVNALVRPVLTFLTLPITFLTLGLFLFVVNGVAFGLAAWITPGFTVSGLWQAILGSVLLTVVSWVLGAMGLRADDGAKS